ncbi:squalene/phytoene synthase family protein [Lentzea cavernae]|uniref:Uncharacterized protein n=1 Tax=Lentzea cavernae TaxID=2020703 RepID=A0ABQ3MLV9_9PSEU|nr:squalene/phytoene synthase family protein [Lentzea cavernae]GHH52871.1 hypothetical protein GCM10017774_65480 [Lentzea cavernae]
MSPGTADLAGAAGAAPHAARLGVAFRLTDFLRGVGEDPDRGRVHQPQDVPAAHGVDHDLVQWRRLRRSANERVQRVFNGLVAHSYAIYRSAKPGIDMLDAASRLCVRAVYTLYRDSLGLVGCEVLWRRVAVSNARRMAVAVRGAGLALVTRMTNRAMAPVMSG